MRFILSFLAGGIVGVLLLLLMQRMIIVPNGKTKQIKEKPVALVMRVVAPKSEPKPPPEHHKPKPPQSKPPGASSPPKLDTIDITKVQPPTDTIRMPPGTRVVDVKNGPGVPGQPARAPGGCVNSVVPLLAVSPPYPLKAARQGIEGSVELAFTVLPDGSVRDVTVVHAAPAGYFEAAAKHTLARWTFQPACRDGRPVAQRAQQTIEFRFDK